MSDIDYVDDLTYVSPRATRLKKALERKMIRGDGNLGVSVTADIERMRYWTESMKQTEGEPTTIRRAKALDNFLSKKTIFIMDDELITGHVGKDTASLPFYFEFYSDPILRQCMASEFALSKEEWAEFEELENYWRGKTSEDIIINNYPEELKEHVYPCDFGSYKAVYGTLYRYSGNSPSADLEMLFEKGVNGIIEDIDKSMERWDPDKCEASEVQDHLKRWNELRAMKIAANAVIKYVDRHAKLASEMAAKEKDPVRKAELEEMAKCCDIAHPTTSFQQAVQLAWFEHTLSRALEMQAAGSPHRMDYVLYPYYKHDIEAGTLTEEKAREILEDMWLKYERIMGCLVPANVKPNAVGSNMLFQHFTLGGVDPATGRDCTNDLSYMMLDVSSSLHTVQPALSIRVNEGTPDRLLSKCWDVLKQGTGGNPSFFGDKPVIEHLLAKGFSLYDARNNCVAGCVAVSSEGKNILTQLKVSGSENMPYLLSLALNNGVNIINGAFEGVEVGDSTKFSYEELVDALMKEVNNIFYWGWRGTNISRPLDAEITPLPWVSCLNKQSIEEGIDAREGCDYSYPFFGCCSGIVDCADALAVIKKLVFEDKVTTIEELNTACHANWEGYEILHQQCLDVPKFGDGNDLPSDILNDLYERIGALAATYKDSHGVPYDVQYHSVSTFLSYGSWTPALPNGRHSGDPLYDGGISPAAGHGKDPVTILNDVAKVDASKTQRILHNMRLNPNTTNRQFIDFMRTWCDMGLSQIQFNVVKTETLRDAQKKPEEYEDLLVRVAGFSAVYVNLAPYVQETIIERCEQNF